MEPHESKGDNEASATPFTLPPRKTETTRYGKIMHIAESFFETLACYKYTNNILATVLIILFVLTFILDIVAIVAFASLTGGNDPTLMLFVFRPLMLLPFMFSTCGITEVLESYKHKSRRHFTDLRGSEKSGLIVCIITSLIYVAFIIIPGVRIWDILAIICVALRFLLALTMAFVNAQRATKLRFDPTSKNQYYPNISTISQSKGEVEIVESSVFRITLKNIGNEIWNSEHFHVHRHCSFKFGTQCVDLKLPSFTLDPQEQINLVPEKYSFEGKCIRIPGVHCFGNTDRGAIVKTFVADSRTKCKYLQEEDGRCKNQTKVAEFYAVITPAVPEWPHVTVNVCP